MTWTFGRQSTRWAFVATVLFVLAGACTTTSTTTTAAVEERNVRSATVDEDILDAETAEPVETVAEPTPSPTEAPAATPTPTSPPAAAIATDRVPGELTAEEEQCFEDSGFTFADLATAITDTGTSGAEAQRLALDLTFQCAPGLALSDAWLAEFGPSYFLGTGVEPTIEETRCLVQVAIDSGRPGDVLLAIDDSVDVDELFSCLSPENRAIIEGSAGPANVGDDPEADQLYDLCLRGSLEACDLLFWQVALDGEYYDVAFDCGGAPALSDFWCVEGLVDDDQDGLIDEGSPGLEPLAERCRGGDMASCDLLFLQTEIGSTYERIGQTCGERVAVPPAKGCIGQFGPTA